MAVVILLLVGIWGGVCFGLLKERTAARQQLASAQREYKVFLPQVQELQQGLLLQKAIRNRPDVGGLFRQLSSLPSNIYLTQLDLKKGTIYLFGFVVGKASDVQEVPDQLVVQLQEEFLSNAVLVSKPQMSQGADALEFKIKGGIHSEGDYR